MNPPAVPIPDNLSYGDVIHPSDGKSCVFIEYRGRRAYTEWLSFVRATGYADPTGIYCVRIEYKSPSKYPSNYKSRKASS